MASRMLERNVRPKRIAEDESAQDYSQEDEDEDEGGVEDAGSDEADEESGSEEEDEGAEGESGMGEDEGEDTDAEGEVEPQFSNISFGALKQAQDTLSRKRKRGSDVPDNAQDDKLEALRKRLRQIKEEKAREATTTDSHPTRSKPGVRANVTATANDASDDDRDPDDEADSDSDSAPSEEGAPTHARTSKHAPRAQSSRHQVTRKRTVVEVPKTHIRDPRFDLALQQRSAHPGSNSAKQYAFLRDYRKTEIVELKTALKRATSEEDRATLRRKVNSMENKIKSEEAKEREQAVVRAHRREEKGRVAEGKTPFYLKEKEVRARALVEKFKGMKGKEREKLVEKRRKKEGQREKKRMPGARRVVG